MAETFPLYVRSVALSYGVFLNFGSNILVSMTFLTLQEAITEAGSYLLYGLVGVISVFFIYFLVPETKGKTLEQISQLLEKGYLVINCGKSRL